MCFFLCPNGRWSNYIYIADITLLQGVTRVLTFDDIQSASFCVLVADGVPIADITLLQGVTKGLTLADFQSNSFWCPGETMV